MVKGKHRLHLNEGNLTPDLDGFAAALSGTFPRNAKHNSGGPPASSLSEGSPKIATHQKMDGCFHHHNDISFFILKIHSILYFDFDFTHVSSSRNSIFFSIALVKLS